MSTSSHWLLTPSGQRRGGGFVDDTLQRRVAEQGLGTRFPLAGDFPRQRVEVLRAQDPQEAVNRLYYERGWTDGLPIFAPTMERVDAMLRGTALERDASLGALDPLKGEAIVEKVAANAVMAGCESHHLPVVLAAVRAIASAEFNLRGVQTTDENVAPLLVVSTPEPQRFELNSSFGALGPGWRGNAAIGRALRLVMNNIGGGWPAVVSLAGLGQPGRYSLCFAEAQANSPWPPLREDFGFGQEDSVLFVFRAESVINVTGGLAEISSVMRSAASAFSLAHGGKVCVVVAPYTAQRLAAAGMSKWDVQRRLFEDARLAREDVQKMWIRETIEQSQWPAWTQPDVAGEAIPIVESAEHIVVTVAGGDLSIAQHAYFPTWGFPPCCIPVLIE